MDKFEYIEGNADLLDIAEPLWVKLNQIHSQVSPHFSHHFSVNSFSHRKKALLEKSRQGMLRIDLARRWESEKYVGYCISTIDEKKVGEIESIFVEEAFRNDGIGGRLMQKTLDWMDAEQVRMKRVCVVVGNENAYPFYTKYGFFPRTSVLVQKNDE